MNKEEIDNLENYLKNYLPKIEPTIPIANFGSIDLEDLMSSIKQFKKVPTFDELLKENKKLKEQLEEKEKVINKTIEFVRNGKDGKGQFYKCCMRKVSMKEDEELLEILERGKNGK